MFFFSKTVTFPFPLFFRTLFVYLCFSFYLGFVHFPLLFFIFVLFYIVILILCSLFLYYFVHDFYFFSTNICNFIRVKIQVKNGYVIKIVIQKHFVPKHKKIVLQKIIFRFSAFFFPASRIQIVFSSFDF